MRALVTGAAGFVGRHTIVELRHRGYEITGIDVTQGIYGWQADMIQWLYRDANVYDLVVHAAARSPHRAAIDTAPGMHTYNSLLDSVLFEWAIRTKQRRVLYLSSCAALDDNPDAYGQTKLHGERLASHARRCGVPVTVVRPYSGYGEDQGPDWPFGAFAARARSRMDPFEIWGDGTQVRDWIHVDDVVRGALAAVEDGTTEPVSLCTGIGTSINQLAEMMTASAGYAPTFRHVAAEHAGAPRRVGDPTLLHTFYRPETGLDIAVRRAVHQNPMLTAGR